ncbi:MAG TPA: hypothetical protein VHP38_05345 [Ruminiclostridium sp.]|nr:hypothetical protein [Ruminiclostridium sp.]
MNKLSKKIFIKSKRSIKRIQKVYTMITISVLLFNFNSISVFAADFGSSVFATGTKSLFTDIGKYLIILAPIAGATVGAYFFIRRGAADEMEQKKWNDRIKATVISTIGAVLVGALIALIAAYYGKSVTTGIE